LQHWSSAVGMRARVSGVAPTRRVAVSLAASRLGPGGLAGRAGRQPQRGVRAQREEQPLGGGRRGRARPACSLGAALRGGERRQLRSAARCPFRPRVRQGVGYPNPIPRQRGGNCARLARGARGAQMQAPVKPPRGAACCLPRQLRARARVQHYLQGRSLAAGPDLAQHSVAEGRGAQPRRHAGARARQARVHRRDSLRRSRRRQRGQRPQQARPQRPARSSRSVERPRGDPPSRSRWCRYGTRG